MSDVPRSTTSRTGWPGPARAPEPARPPGPSRPPEPSRPPRADPPHRVDVTPVAAALLRDLATRHGPLMFHQSGGCCDGSSPMCYVAGEFLTAPVDVHLGDLDVSAPGEPAEPVPVWMGGAQYALWEHTHLTIDVVVGRGAGFSLEAPTGHRFIVRSRLFSDAEALALEAAGPPRRGV